ncbi:MAG: hypothetical protein Kow00106_19610 [Anaerolineae bacterium]
MNSKVRVLLIVALTLSAVVWGAVSGHPARAAGEEWVVTGRLSSGCNSGDTFFQVEFRNLTPGATYYADTIVKDMAGTVYMDEYFSDTAPGPFDNDWGVFDVNSRGLQTGSFPLPAGVRLVMTVTLRDASEQVLSTYSVEFTCDGGGFQLFGVPGCDQFLPISASSVVGSFVADTPLYWAPGALTNPLITIPAGKTAWVLGTDASGQYYKIIWACSQVYVPVGSMGPNFDAVWNGRALPTSNAD